MGDSGTGVGKILSKLSLSGKEKKYRHELELAAEQYESIFEYTGAGMIVIAPDTTIIRANHKAAEISGHSLDTLHQGHKWTEFISSEVATEEVLAIREKRIAGASSLPIQYETEITHRDGSVKYLLVHVSEIPGSENILSSFIDITALKTAHTKLRESEKRFKETADLLPVIICEFTREMKFTYVNQKGYEIFGYDPLQVSENSISFKDFFPEDEQQHLEDGVQRRWLNPQEKPAEYRMVTASGEIRNFLIVSSPIIRENAEPGLRSCLVDITDVKQIERELVQREQRLRAIFDSSPIGITVLDSDGLVQEMNHSFAKIFQIETDTIEQLPSLFTMLNFDPAVGMNGETEILFGVRFVKNRGSYEAVPVESSVYSWHITPLCESEMPQYLCQVIDITTRFNAAQKRITDAEAKAEGLQKQLNARSKEGNLVSRSKQLQEQFEMLPTIAETSATLLINGESGTGKEVLANAIHRMSDRADKPFVAINCGALPDTLLESELFGHVAGAFTDARKDRKGKFLSADGGTIFLDEIGEISPQMQVKLLRVLQERVITPLGSDKSRSVDVRVITATNRDLADMVREGTFREDLYYRVKVLNFTLPPLRERRADIPLLCEQFIEQFNGRYNKKIEAVSSKTVDLLLSFSFPGNIRELQNVIEHACIFCNGVEIEPEHLPPELRSEQSGGFSGTLLNFDSIRSFEELEMIYLQRKIEENGGNKTETAHKLGMHKATLFRKLKKLEESIQELDEKEGELI